MKKYDAAMNVLRFHKDMVSKRQIKENKSEEARSIMEDCDDAILLMRREQRRLEQGEK